jgi:hypothetical protein
MRAAGFRLVRLSHGVMDGDRRAPSHEDTARALELNNAWDRVRKGLPEAAVARHTYPPGSVGDGYRRAMAMRQEERTAKNIVWTKEHHSRDDWPRAWKHIGPIFADCDPQSITPELLLRLRTSVATQVSDSEAHRLVKVWRALWKRMSVLGYCQRDRDPSLMFANSAPQPRQAVWTEGEAVRLVKQAWRCGYTGLAVALAVSWDSQLSPVDSRSLRANQLRQDAFGAWFQVSRAKTGRAAVATLSRRARRLLETYLAANPAIGATPLFRNRSNRPFSKDGLGDDFRDIRAMVFGPDERRQLADFRRSGTVEALAGNASPSDLSTKMANSLSASNKLHKTYAPVQLGVVRDVDQARQKGRIKLRSGEQNPAESVTEPDRKVSHQRSVKKGPLK